MSTKEIKRGYDRKHYLKCKKSKKHLEVSTSPKQCTSCDEFKLPELFAVKPTRKDGRNGEWKECTAVRSKITYDKWIVNNKDRKAKSMAKYYRKNLEKKR